MAPGSAGIPYLIPQPSKAGPPAAEVTHSLWPSHSAISEFVPKSMSRPVPSSPVSPVAMVSAKRSEPTKPPRGWTISNKTSASMRQPLSHCCPSSGRQSMAAVQYSGRSRRPAFFSIRSASIAVLPTTEIRSIFRKSYPSREHMSIMPSSIESLTIRLISDACAEDAHAEISLVIISEPWRDCRLGPRTEERRRVLLRSHRDMLMFVVPRSRATPSDSLSLPGSLFSCGRVSNSRPGRSSRINFLHSDLGAGLTILILRSSAGITRQARRIPSRSSSPVSIIDSFSVGSLVFPFSIRTRQRPHAPDPLQPERTLRSVVSRASRRENPGSTVMTRLSP